VDVVEALTISGLARSAGVPVETVRYYERRGLLEPPPRTPHGYRQYPQDAVWRLAFILRAKDLGFTLAEIAGLLGGEGRTTEVVTARARARLSRLDDEMARLADVRGRLVSLLSVCAEGSDEDCVGLRPGGWRPGAESPPGRADPESGERAGPSDG
jgi:MerR family mercuric resistance operon transcriptional regulator